MPPFLEGAIALIEASQYGLLFISTLLGSPVVMIAAGYLIHTGQLSFWATYGTIVAADIVGDIVWYWVGRFGARSFLLRYGYVFGVTEELIEKLEGRFNHYHERILIISKMTMGFGMAIGVLAVAGMMRVPFMRYLFINLSGELVWALIPIGIGYYFGNIADLLPESLRLWFALLGLIIVVIITRHVLKKLAQKEW